MKQQTLIVDNLNLFYYIEAKEAIINKAPWSPSEKQEIQELVNKYPQKASKIDWNKIKELSADDVLKILKEESKKEIKKVIRSGFEGLIEGKDYITLYNKPELQIYAPLNHKASCTIGRDTKWCTSMENKNHWDEYVIEGMKFLYIIMPTDDPLLEPYTKLAVAINTLSKHFQIFDKLQDSFAPNENLE